MSIGMHSIEQKKCASTEELGPSNSPALPHFFSESHQELMHSFKLTCDCTKFYVSLIKVSDVTSSVNIHKIT